MSLEWNIIWSKRACSSVTLEFGNTLASSACKSINMMVHIKVENIGLRWHFKKEGIKRPNTIFLWGSWGIPLQIASLQQKIPQIQVLNATDIKFAMNYNNANNNTNNNFESLHWIKHFNLSLAAKTCVQ